MLRSRDTNIVKLTTFILAILCHYQFAFGQVDSDNGLFTADYASGCAPLTINVTPSEPSEADGFIYEFNGEFAGIVEDESYEYTEPGIYTIAYIKNAGASNPETDFLTITILPAGTSPQFDIFTCKNNEILIDFSRDENFENFAIRYGDGSSPEAVNSPQTQVRHTYSIIPNPINIVVEGNNNTLGDAGNCPTVTEGVNLISGGLTQADFTEVITENYSSSDGRIILNFNLQDNNIYRLFQSTGTSGFSELDTISGTETSRTITSLNTASNPYCFRIDAYDACDNTFVPSVNACNLRISGQATNAQNQVSWTTNTTPLSNLAIYRDGNLFDNISPATNTGSWSDIDLVCDQDYIYFAETFYSGTNDPNGFSMTSNTITLTALFNEPLPATSNLIADVNIDESISLTWTSPDPQYDYQILKSTNTSNLVPIDRVNVEQYTDEATNLDLTNCYSIRTTDNCGNFSENAPVVCPSILDGEFIASSGSADLEWTEYLTEEYDIVQYEVEYLDPNLNLLETLYSGPDLNVIEKPVNIVQSAYLRVKITLSDGSIVYSNVITADLSPAVIHPTAFTPNGDMLNDEITFFGRFISTFNIYLYNRWGEFIKKLDDNNPTWNGIVKGEEVEPGTYVYVIEGVTESGEPFNQKGSITLIR